MGADILAGISLILDWHNLLFIMVGVSIGIVLGAIPGLSATMGIAMVIPITFYMSPVASISMLIGAYKGGLYGGSISAIMIGAPGTDSASATVMDGYEMAKQGKSGKALKIAVWASVIGDFIGMAALVLLAPMIAEVALKIGPGDFAMIILFSLTIIAGVSGKSLVKGMISCSFGLLFGTVGMDPIIGLRRLTFDILELDNGISVMGLLIGLFAIPELILQMESKITATGSLLVSEGKPEDRHLSWKEFVSCLRVIFLGGGIGIIIGAIPGIGPTVSAWMSYGQAKKVSKHPELIGKGSLEGVAAAESGNNATCGGALIPMLTLGVPGSISVAILMGAFIIQGIFPGPMIFKEHGPLVYAIFAGLVISNLVLLGLALLAVNTIAPSLCDAPKKILYPLILACCYVGSFAVTTKVFDIKIMLACGLLGYLMRKTGFPAAPLLIGFILGPIGERAIRQFMIVADNDFSRILYHPVAVVFIVLTIISIVGIARGEWKKAQQKAREVRA